MPDLRHGDVQNPRWQVSTQGRRRPGDSICLSGTVQSTMAQQLAYVIITPYSLHKSRTGGILSRLITRTGMELAGARMFAPSAELVTKYAEATISANDPQDRRIQDLIYRYIQQNLAPDPKTGRRRRVMM